MPSKPRMDQALEGVPAEITTALQILVHDLCSPVQSLIASNESLAMQTLDDEGRQAVARIRRATQSLSAQLNDLTALARVQAGDDARAHDISFEAGALLQDVAALGNYNLKVIAPLAPIFARGDAALILQVLDRLVRTVVGKSQARATLVVEAAQPQGELSFRLKCAGRPALPNKIVQGLILVRVIASALKGDLETVLTDPSGLLLILRVAVQFEDPDALATK